MNLFGLILVLGSAGFCGFALYVITAAKKEAMTTMLRIQARRAVAGMAAILIGTLASGCDLSDVVYGLSVLSGDVSVFDRDYGNSCDDWNDIFDSDCH